MMKLRRPFGMMATQKYAMIVPPQLPDRGKGTLSERTSEVCLAGVVCDGSPSVAGRVDRFEDATPRMPDGVVADPQPPHSRNIRTPITWTLR